MKNVVTYETTNLLKLAVADERLQTIFIREENEKLIYFVDKWVELVLINIDDYKWEEVQDFIIKLKNYKDDLVIVLGSLHIENIKRDAFLLEVYNFLDFNEGTKLDLSSQIQKTAYTPRTHKDCWDEVRELLNPAPVLNDDGTSGNDTQIKTVVETVVETKIVEKIVEVPVSDPSTSIQKQLFHLDVRGNMVQTYAYANMLAHHFGAKLDWCNEISKDEYFQKRISFLEDPEETHMILVAPTDHNKSFDNCYIVVDALEHCIYNETHKKPLSTKYRSEVIEVNSCNATANSFKTEDITKIYENDFEGLEYDLSCFGVSPNEVVIDKPKPKKLWSKRTKKCKK